MNPSISSQRVGSRFHFRPSAGGSPRVEATDPIALAAWAGAVRGVSMVLLSLLPALLWHRSLGPFTFCKNAVLQLGGLALVALGAGAAWCCSWDRLRVVGLRLLREPLVVAVLLGLLSATVSTLFSICPGASWRGVSDHRNGLAQVLCLGVVFFAARLGWGRADIPSGFVAVLIGFGLTSGYAVFQVIGLDPLAWSDVSIYGERVRPTGAVGHTNTLAALIVLTMPLLVYLVVTTWGAAVSRGRTIRLLSRAALGLVGFGLLVLTLSRAGWLGLAVVTFALLLLWPGNRRKRVMAAVGSLGVALLICVAVCVLVPHLGSAVSERAFHLGESSSRREIWATALRIFAEYPCTGCGLDTFGMSFMQFRTSEYWRFEWGLVADQAHNEFLHTMATQGAIGAVAWIGLRVALVWSLIRAWRQREQRPLVAVIGASLLGYDVVHLFGFATSPIALVHLACLGWLARLAATDDRSDSEDLPSPSRLGWLPFACLGVGCAVLTMNFLLWSEQPWTRWLLVSGLIALGGTLALLAEQGERITHATDLREGKRAALAVGLLLAVLCGQGMIGPVLASWHASRADSFPPMAPEQVIESLATAVRLAPDEARFHAARAKGLQDLAQRPEMGARKGAILREAVAAGEETCRLEPVHAVHHANRGRILGDAARAGVATPEAVFAAFDRALELDPNDTHCLADAGRAAVSLGLPDRGEPYLERGLRLDEDLAFLHAELGGISLVRKDYGRAEASLELALSKNWHNEWERRERSRCLLALVKLEQGDPRSALTLIETALDSIPEFLPARWLYASALERIGNREAALAAYRFVLSRQPDHEAAAAAVRRLGGS